MTVTIEYLEGRIAHLNEWLKHHDKSHLLFVKQKHRRDYYVNKIIEMTDLGFRTTNI